MSKTGSPQSPPTADQETTEQARSRFRRWFWGAFVVLMVLTIALEITRSRRLQVAASRMETTASVDPIEDEMLKPKPENLSAKALERLLGRAGAEAVTSARTLTPTLVDEAYAPVYAAVPVYADYHYSVWGQYAELGAAALGDVGLKIEKTLFDGLKDRLADASLKIDDTFNEAFEAELAAGLAAGHPSGAALGDLTHSVVADTRERMVVTMPLATSAVLGAAWSVKLASGAMAKSIAAKLAIKVAAKTGGKWVAAGTGASAGAALCSWSGPGAGVCAAVGGVGAFLLVDSGIMMLDEFWSRDDFEANMRRMIDESKRDHIAAFERAIDMRIAAVQRVSDATVQRQDFTLRELSGEGSAEICAIADVLGTTYEALRGTLGARTPARLDAVRILAADHADDLSIGLYARQVLDNLRSAGEVEIETVRVIGNLPSGFEANRKVTLRLRLGERIEEISRSDASSDNGFDASITFDVVEEIGADLPINLRIEQHRYWFNRYFAGAGELMVDEELERTSEDLRPVIVLPVSVSYDDDAGSLDEASAGGPDRSNISLHIRVSAAALPPLDVVSRCR